GVAGPRLLGFLLSGRPSPTTRDHWAGLPIATPSEKRSSAVAPRGNVIYECRSAQAGLARVWPAPLRRRKFSARGIDHPVSVGGRIGKILSRCRRAWST